MRFLSSAPGRADFLNTHQDYKGLPVVPIAISLRTSIEAEPRSDDMILAESAMLKGMGEEYVDKFSAQNPVYRERTWWGNYLRAVARAVSAQSGARLRGLDVKVESDIPIASGLSSSAALEVAFAEMLNRVHSLNLGAGELAETCYRAEHDELGIPCGRLDQYGSAFGGVILLETRPPFRVEELPPLPFELVIADSGVRHSTAEIHPVRQREIDNALADLIQAGLPAKVRSLLGPRFDQVAWERIALEDLSPYLASIDEVGRRRVLFTLLMQRSTMTALEALRNERVDLPVFSALLGCDRAAGLTGLHGRSLVGRVLGDVVNFQHELLRDLYDVSHPRLESLRDALLASGVLGAKVSGAGMGGSLLALAEKTAVAQGAASEALAAGATTAVVVRMDRGAWSTVSE